MTIYTFYSQGRDGQIRISGTLDNKTGEYSGEEADVLKSMVASAEVDITKEEELLKAFYDGSRVWIRKGEPFGPLLERERRQKTPRITFSRSEET